MMTTLFIVVSILSITHGQTPSNNAIVNDLNYTAFTSSSVYDATCEDEHARYFEPGATDAASLSWCADSSNLDQRPLPWLQIDLGQCYTITDVGTKGRYNGYYVTEYILSYSTHDPSNLLFYNGIPGYVTGNTGDPNSEVFGVDSSMNHPSFTARYARFTPIDWGYPAMRVELYGFENPSCTPPLEPCLCSDGSLGEVITYGTDCSNTATENGIMCDLCSVTQCKCSNSTCTYPPTTIPSNSPSKTPTKPTTSPTSPPTADSSDDDDIFDANNVDNNEINNYGLNGKYNTDQIKVNIHFSNVTMIYVWIIVAVISICIAIACWLLRSRKQKLISI